MNTKNLKAAEQTVQLHLVNAIARALAADAHVEYLRAPARIAFKSAEGARPGKKDRNKADPEPEATAEAASLLLNLLGHARAVDPKRLAPDPRRILPYLVSVNPLTVTAQTGDVLTVPEAQIALEPAEAPEAWHALRENPRNPVAMEKGRWRWKDGVAPEVRAHWLALASLVQPELPVQAAALKARRQQEAKVRERQQHEAEQVAQASKAERERQAAEQEKQLEAAERERQAERERAAAERAQQRERKAQQQGG